MKICVLGNSHVGAIKRAWDRISEQYSYTEMVFFGGRSNTLEELQVCNGKLTPGNRKLKRSIEFTSGGASEIDPELYDFFLVYGLGLYIRNFPEGDRYSSSFLSELALERIRDTVSYHMLLRLRDISRKPIYVGHVPLAANFQGPDCQEFFDYGFSFDIFRTALEKLGNVTLVKQPDITIVDGGYTEAKYTKGSRRMAVGASNDNAPHPETDCGHMNDDFGEVWLKQFLRRLS